MEVFFLKAGQLVAALSLLVIIHEFGHYLFARIFGIRVNKFFLFFNPWFYLVKYNPKTRKWSFFKDKTDKKSASKKPQKFKCRGCYHRDINKRAYYSRKSDLARYRIWRRLVASRRICTNSRDD